MNKILLLLGIAMAVPAFAQAEGPFGGEYKLQTQNEDCLTESHRHEIRTRLAAKKEELTRSGKFRRTAALGAHPQLQWPVIKNPETQYNNVWGLSNFFDHNSNFPNQVQDYNCGSRTYDTNAGYNHQGVDIFTWPFGWYQMANNQSWAVAAAPGIIVGKDNGHADTSCAMNGGMWNAVYILQEDGSTAWYGHLKNNSLTTKAVGQTVAAGEFLGVIGSSGNSTGPHLHFELYNSSDILTDPYAGPCNPTIAVNDSWWQTQRPYMDPKVNAVFTHSAPPVFPTCPQQEQPNFKSEFNVGETVYAAGYFADQDANVPIYITLTNPSGATYYTSSATVPVYYAASWWYWTFNPGYLNQIGVWTVTYTIGSESVSRQFAYGTTLSGETFGQQPALSFYPNPGRDKITFTAPIAELEAISVEGKRFPIATDGVQADISALPNGMYLLTGVDAQGRSFKEKLVK